MQIESEFFTGLQNNVLSNQERGEEEEGTDFWRPLRLNVLRK